MTLRITLTGSLASFARRFDCIKRYEVVPTARMAEYDLNPEEFKALCDLLTSDEVKCQDCGAVGLRVCGVCMERRR